MVFCCCCVCKYLEHVNSKLLFSNPAAPDNEGDTSSATVGLAVGLSVTVIAAVVAVVMAVLLLWFCYWKSPKKVSINSVLGPRRIIFLLSA